MAEQSKFHEGIGFIRALACLMVISVHCVECFYISSVGELIKDHGFAVGILGSAFRAAVPLFVMVSGGLLLPIRTSSECFLKRRLRRVLLPFIFWSAIYAVVLLFRGAYDWASCLKFLAMIPIQFSPYVGWSFHLRPPERPTEAARLSGGNAEKLRLLA